VTGTLSAVNMLDFACHKAGGFQEHQGIDDVLGDLGSKVWLTISELGPGTTFKREMTPCYVYGKPGPAN
jgi:hypothetical protein